MHGRDVTAPLTEFYTYMAAIVFFLFFFACVLIFESGVPSDINRYIIMCSYTKKMVLAQSQ